jgi:fatty acid desaturase
MLQTRHALDFVSVFAFFVRNYLVFSVWLGMPAGQLFGLYMFMRFLESHWFTWITSMSHLTMPIETSSETGSKMAWIEMHVKGTLNVDGGRIVDWVAGHLNYQVRERVFFVCVRVLCICSPFFFAA